MMDFLSAPDLPALIIGLMVSVVIVIALDRTSDQLRRARSVMAFLCGFLVYYVLRSNPELLEKYQIQIVAALIAILLAFLAFLRRQF
jgi:hypothetical protein